MTIEALVVYINCVYFGFARKLKLSGSPSSIFESLETSISGFPSTSPSKITAICAAVNFKIMVL